MVLPRFPFPLPPPGFPSLVTEEEVEEKGGMEEAKEDAKETEQDSQILNNEEQELISQVRSNPTLKGQVIKYVHSRANIDPEKSLANWKQSMIDEFGIEPGPESSKAFYEGLKKSLGRV